MDKALVDEVTILPTRRGLNEAAVAELMKSMEKIGLQSPITVRFAKVEDGTDVVLIAGRHRLEAARRLGWKTIDCIYQPWNDTQARMWEIAENLHRADLTALERAEQTNEWRELAEEVDEKRDQSGQLVQIEKSKREDGKGHRRESGISKAARELPVSGSTPEAKRKTVQRAVKIAEDMTPEAKDAAVAAGLDSNQSALLKIAAAPKQEQVRVVQAIQSEKAEQKARKHESKRDTSCAEDFAAWLKEKAAAEEIPAVISWLEAEMNKYVIAALRR